MAPMPSLLLARRHLARHGARAVLTAAGIACGVALVVAIELINASTLRAFTDAIDDLAGATALQVRGQGPFPEAVAGTIRGVPGVANAVPVLTDTFFAVDGPAAGEALAVFAADVTDGHAIRTLRLVRSGERVVDDPLSFLVDPASVVLTEDFARRIGARDGTVLRLRTPAGVQPFTVRGILPAGGVGRAFGGNLLLLDVVGAQTMLGREGRIDQVDVALAPGVAVEDAARAIAAVLPAGLEAVRPARRGEQIERILGSYRTLLSGLSGLALLAAVFVVTSAIATDVAARRQQIGLLRCIGAERRQIMRLVIGHAVLLGIAGTAAGLPLGVALGRVLLDAVGESAEIVFSIRRFASPLGIPARALGLGIAAGLGASVAAAVLPARTATAIGAIAAVRATPADPVRRRWPAPGVLPGALVVAAGGIVAQVRWDAGWAGNLAALAVDVALVCGFMRLVGPVAGSLLRPLRKRLGIVGQLAADRLARIPDPLALAGGVLALCLGLVLLAGTLAESFERSVLSFIRHQVRADLVVASSAAVGWIESPSPDWVGDRLAALPGVARVERLRLAEQEFRGQRISVDSLDPAAFAAARRDDFVFAAGEAATALPAVARGEAVLVSRNFARLFGVGVGDRVALDTPAGRLALPVAGAVVDYVSPRGSIILARPVWLRWWGDPGVTRFHLTLAPGTSAEAVRRAIARDVGGREGLKILTQRELYAYHQDAVRRAFRFTAALQALPLVVAALGLAEALLAVMLHRRRELALLRAAGSTRRQVARGVLAEAAGVGGLGMLGGLVMGLVLSLLWVRVNFAHQLGWDLELHLALRVVPAAAAIALLVSLGAALLPARRTARLPILDALRAE